MEDKSMENENDVLSREKLRKHMKLLQDLLNEAPTLGSGGRFKALKGKLAAKGATNPGALAAYIGRKKSILATWKSAFTHSL